ncbi:MAG TPA: hypothetical protein VFB54_15480, partial [Burkholderiales bacterium]|nr:hypothetical protein [Burkholderiales bacterium]
MTVRYVFQQSLAVLGALALLSFATAVRSQSPDTCPKAIGRIVSIQGDVRLLRAGAAAWVAVKRLDTALCQGDQLRTGLLSRAGV